MCLKCSFGVVVSSYGFVGVRPFAIFHKLPQCYVNHLYHKSVPILFKRIRFDEDMCLSAVDKYGVFRHKNACDIFYIHVK